MKKLLIITAACLVIVVALSLFCVVENDRNRLYAELCKAEYERNALSDAIRCYADTEEPLILDYAAEFLYYMDIGDSTMSACCDSLGRWANCY